MVTSLFDFQAELVLVLLIYRGPRLNQLLHKLTSIDVLWIDNLRGRGELDQELV